MSRPASILAGCLVASLLLVISLVLNAATGAQSGEQVAPPRASGDYYPPFDHCSDWIESSDVQVKREIVRWGYSRSGQFPQGPSTRLPQLTNTDVTLLVEALDDLCADPATPANTLVAYSVPLVIKSEPQLRHLQPGAIVAS